MRSCTMQWCREWKFKIQKIDRYKKYHEADLLQSVEENPWGHLDVDQILRPSCAAIPKTRREDVWKLPPTFAEKIGVSMRLVAKFVQSVQLPQTFRLVDVDI